jgi:hypothetical protein
MSKAPPTTSESSKNASGQEAFGRKMPETLVVESSAISAADVMSTAGGAGATAAFDADKTGTSAPPAAEGEGGDHCATGPQPTLGPQPAMEEGTRSEGDQYRCLYVSTPWEAEVVTDRRDVEEFKEASRTIGRVLSVRALVNSFEFLALGRYVLQGMMAFCLFVDVVSC